MWDRLYTLPTTLPTTTIYLYLLSYSYKEVHAPTKQDIMSVLHSYQIIICTNVNYILNIFYVHTCFLRCRSNPWSLP